MTKFERIPIKNKEDLPEVNQKLKELITRCYAIESTCKKKVKDSQAQIKESNSILNAAIKERKFLQAEKKRIPQRLNSMINSHRKWALEHLGQAIKNMEEV